MHGMKSRRRLARELCALLASGALVGSGIATAADPAPPAEEVSDGSAADSALHEDENPKFGLTLAQRKAVFLELAAAERRAEREAESANIDPPESMEQVDLTQRLALEYKDAVAEKHGLTREQAVALSVEGVESSWDVE